MRGKRAFNRAALGALLSLAACVPESLQERLDAAPVGASLSVPAGDHQNLVLRRAVTLVGQGDATRLTGVTLLSSSGDVRLESLALPAGLEVPEGASATLERVSVACSDPSAGGLSIKGRLTAREVVVAPGCGWGLDVQKGHAVIDGSRLSGERGAARVVDGELTATGTAFAATDARNAAVFAARSVLRLERVTLSGGEHGLLMRDGILNVLGLNVHASIQAAVALVGTRARLAQVQAEGPYSLAAVQVSESASIEVNGLSVRAAGAAGVLALRSTIALSEVDVAGTRGDADGDFGHAITLQDSTADIRGMHAAEISGAALYASDSTVRVRGLQARTMTAALVAMRSEVQVQGMSAESIVGPEVYAADGARVRLGDMQLTAGTTRAVCVDAEIADSRGTSLCQP